MLSLFASKIRHSADYNLHQRALVAIGICGSIQFPTMGSLVDENALLSSTPQKASQKHGPTMHLTWAPAEKW